MFLLIFLGLLGLGIYYFVGAVWALLCVCPFILVLPYIFVKDVVYAWKNADKFAAAEKRRKAFEADMEEGIRQHEVMFPEANDFDENGIPYL